MHSGTDDDIFQGAFLMIYLFSFHLLYSKKLEHKLIIMKQLKFIILYPN